MGPSSRKVTNVRIALPTPKILSGPIARATFRTTVVLVARLVVQAGTLLVLARLFGSAQYGTFASLVALAFFLGAMAPFGTQLTLVREISRDPHQRQTVLSAAIGTTLVVGAALLCLYLVISLTLLSTLTPDPLAVLAIGIAELLVQPLLVVSSMEWLANGKIARSQMMRVLPLPLQLLTATTLWWTDVSDALSLYALGHLGATIVALCISLTLLPEAWPAPKTWRLLKKNNWKDHAGFALLSLSASGPTELDKALAARLLPLGAAGVYSAAARIAGALVIPISSMMMSALPRLFRESGNSQHGSTLLRMIFGSGLAYGLLAAGAIWIIAPFVEPLFGHSFTGLANTIRWFSLAVPSFCLRLTAVNVLMSMGNPWLRVGIEATGTVLIASCAIVLTQSGSTKGMVFAIIAAETVMALLAWTWIALRYLRSDEAAVPRN
jgi:O-antigen/teichoic acid export membrane protein